MPYSAPSSTGPSSSSTDIIARIRKPSVSVSGIAKTGRAAASTTRSCQARDSEDPSDASSAVHESGSGTREGEGEGEVKGFGADITPPSAYSQPQTQPQPQHQQAHRAFSTVEDEQTPRPESVMTSPLDQQSSVSNANLDTNSNTKAEHLSAQLAASSLGAEGSEDLTPPRHFTASPANLSISHDDTSISNATSPSTSTSNLQSASHSDSQTSLPELDSDRETDTDDAPQTPATNLSDRGSIDESGDGSSGSGDSGHSGGEKKVMRGEKGFHIWELTDELMRYKEGLYHYTHALYLQAKLQNSPPPNPRRNLPTTGDGNNSKSKYPAATLAAAASIRKAGAGDRDRRRSSESEYDDEARPDIALRKEEWGDVKKLGGGYSQFGNKQSGMERLAAKKALAKALNAC